jgi:hypothetical protein
LNVYDNSVVLQSLENSGSGEGCSVVAWMLKRYLAVVTVMFQYPAIVS